MSTITVASHSNKIMTCKFFQDMTLNYWIGKLFVTVNSLYISCYSIKGIRCEGNKNNTNDSKEQMRSSTVRGVCKNKHKVEMKIQWQTKTRLTGKLYNNYTAIQINSLLGYSHIPNECCEYFGQNQVRNNLHACWHSSPGLLISYPLNTNQEQNQKNM